MEVHGLRLLSVAGLHLGPAFLFLYGLMFVAGIALTVHVTRRMGAR
jgi:hypothetical protein